MENTSVPLTKITKIQPGSIYNQRITTPSRYDTEPQPFVRPPPPVIPEENKNTANLSKYL